jgi:hypothetical protein
MAIMALERENVSSLHLAKTLYFVFILITFEAKSTIWRTL